MGLDAWVYRSRESIEAQYGGDRFQFAPETGEPDMPEEYDSEWESLLAASFYIGNIAMVGHLREVIEPVLGAESVVMTRIIYSGIHGGDHIPPAELPQLGVELSALRNHRDPHVVTFVEKIDALLAAAIETGNTIVF